MKRWYWILLLSLAAPVAGQHGPANDRPPRVYSMEPVSGAQAAGWISDLEVLIRELERNHPAPYNRTSKEEFAAAASRLRARIPSLAAHEIVVELERLLALVGDGHTNLNLASGPGVDFHQLPVRFGLYQDGIWVEAADRAYADAVGGRVVAFADVSADTALARLMPIISRDNDQWIQTAVPHLLNLAEVLHALRLSDRLDRAAITVEKGGQRKRIELKPLAQTRPRATFYPFQPRYTSDWLEASAGVTSAPPLYQRDFDKLYWFEYLPEQRLLYIKWDQVMNRTGGESALQVFRNAMAFARENPSRIDKVLLDIRNNTGGEGSLLDPIVREIVRTREVDEPGRFFVAIGPRTFSAGLLFTMQLERYARPIFVGEPTGGKVNVHAGHVFITLPKSGIGVSISPDYYQTSFPRDTRMTVTPRLFVRPAFADFASGRDPVIAAVLAYQGDQLSPALEELVQRSDTLAAADRVRAFDALPINRFTGSTALVNALGYRLLRAQRTEEALRTFRLNVRVHPQYANGWDSLGEAYEQAGRIQDAIGAFERVLQLEPHNGRAREYLNRLKNRL